MNTEVVHEYYGPEVNPVNVNVAWGWDNDKAHKPAHYEMVYKDFQHMAKRFNNPNLYSRKVAYDGFQILHFNTNTDQLFGTVRKWVWDPKSMQRQLMDLVFTMSRTELVIEYRGNNRPGVVIYRLCYDAARSLREGEPLTRWALISDTTARTKNDVGFPLGGKEFVKSLLRDILHPQTMLDLDSAENFNWLVGVLNAWRAVDVIEGDNLQHLRMVHFAFNQVMNELCIARKDPGSDKSAIVFSREAVSNLLLALEPLTQPDTPPPGKLWAQQIDRNMISIKLDPDDPNPTATVSFLVDEYRRQRRYPGVTMNVVDRASKGPNWS